jgi:hypothetical protein
MSSLQRINGYSPWKFTGVRRPAPCLLNNQRELHTFWGAVAISGGLASATSPTQQPFARDLCLNWLRATKRRLYRTCQRQFDQRITGDVFIVTKAGGSTIEGAVYTTSLASSVCEKTKLGWCAFVGVRSEQVRRVLFDRMYCIILHTILQRGQENNYWGVATKDILTIWHVEGSICR